MQQTRDIGAVFDELADGYTQMMEDMVPHYRKLIMSMIEYLPPGFQAGSILDLGCGNGNVTAFCKAFFPDARYHLVDASGEMIQRCRQRFGDPNMRYEQAFFQELRLPERSYDLMIAGFSFHHVPGPDKIHLFKALRVALKDNGILTTADLLVNKDDEPYHTTVLNGWRDFVLSNGRTEADWEWLLDHYTQYDRPNAFEDQKRWLQEAGFGKITLSWHVGPWACFHAT